MSAPLDAIAVSAFLLTRLGELGADRERVLARAGLSPSRFEPNGKLTTREFFALWQAVDAEPGAVHFGVRLTEGRRPADYDVASVAALRSPNLAEALKRFARYKRLTCPELVRVEVKNGEASLRFHWVLAAGAVPRTLVDASFAAFLALVHRGTGTMVSPLRLEFAQRRADPAFLERHFGCPLTFDAPFDRVVLREKDLARPFVTANPTVLNELVPGIEAALAQRSRTSTLDEDVRMAIVRAMCGERPTLERVARDLGVSGRTLQRRLGEAALTYQSLLDDVRKTAARRLLAQTNLEPVDVAFLLGFAEPNSFHRSFTAWEGLTPGKWRGRHVERFHPA